MTGRKRFTTYKNAKSDDTKIVSDIPQESTLGPLFFSIYLNDLPLVTNSHIKLFADDTAIILKGINLIQLQDKVSKELTTIDNWMKHNRLSLNYSKTTYFVISKNNLNNSNFLVQIDKHVIPTSEVVKYLGIKLKNKLKWDNHAELVLKKLNRAAGIISKIRHYVKRKTLINLYYSFMYPHLVYGVFIWGNAGVSALRKIEVKVKVRDSGCKHTLFRPFSIVGPLQFQSRMIERC